MATYWIIGHGRVGRQAVNKLSGRGHQLIVVDPDPAPLADDQSRARLIKADGVQWLAERLAAGEAPDHVIPALPRHLAAGWLVKHSRTRGHKRFEIAPVPDDVKAGLPNAMPGPNQEIYASLADFVCPDDCPEPADICPVTGRKREKPLFRRIQDLDKPGRRSLVVVSRQIGPGLGGFRPQALFRLAEDADRAGSLFLVATACRCHGVVNALRVVS